MKPSELYRSENWTKAPNTNNLTLVGDKVPAGKVVRLDMLIGIDHTTPNKVIRLGYDRGGSKFWVQQEQAATAEHGERLRRPIYLVENEAPAIMVESPTANDEIYLFARGPFV